MTLRTSVTVSYSKGDLGGGDGPILSLQNESTVKPPYGTGYARLFKSPEVTPVLRSTGVGAPYIIQTGISYDAIETLSFNGTETASFQYPNATNVRVTSQGLFLDRNGVPLGNINLTVNTKAGSVRAPVPCYGFVLVSYTSTYSRVSASFALLNPGMVDTEQLESEYAPLTVLAFYQALSSSVTIQPPSKSEKPGNKNIRYVGREDADAPKLIMELDPKFPVSLSPSGSGTTARAVFFVYPGDANPTIQTTSGQVTKLDSFGGTLPGAVYGSSNVDINEPLSFTNTMSVSLKYPPSSAVTVKADKSSFYSMYGTTFTPSFITRDGYVNMVEWSSANQYSIAGTKQARSNEVFVAMLGDLGIQATGVATATYTTTRTAYVLEWPKSGDWFPAVTLFAASIDGRKGELKVEPPVRRGTL